MTMPDLGYRDLDDISYSCSTIHIVRQYAQFTITVTSSDTDAKFTPRWGENHDAMMSLATRYVQSGSSDGITGIRRYTRLRSAPI